jgi:peptidoglycan hydrolase CwlO-like protein
VAPAPTPAAAPAASAANDAEMKKLQRRVDQLTTEIRMMRGGGDKATKMEDLERKVRELEDERDKLKNRVAEFEGKIATEGGDVRVQRAGAVLRQAEDTISGLNDVLSEIRINLMAAEGEVEQWSTQLPKAQFELVREALRSCKSQMEAAKELIHKLQSAMQR